MRARLEIETILFRESAMLQGDRHLVFGIKDGTIPLRVPCLKGSERIVVSGTPGHNTYVAACAEKGVLSQFPFVLPNPDHAVPNTHWDASHPNYPEREGLFIAELDRGYLYDRFLHATTRMYATATRNK